MGDGHSSKRDGADSLGDAGARVPAPTPARAPASRDLYLGTSIPLRTTEQIALECERLYFRIDDELNADKPRKVIGELTDRMIKILRLRAEVIGRADVEDRLTRAEAVMRELAMRLAGGSHGTATARASASAEFAVPGESGAH